MNKILYTAMWALAHDGEDYQAGDPIELDAKEAEPLLTSGVIKPIDEESDLVSIDDIMIAIDELGEEDFTSGGPPEVKALERVLKTNITAAQRDEAWKAYSEQ